MIYLLVPKSSWQKKFFPCVTVEGIILNSNINGFSRLLILALTIMPSTATWENGTSQRFSTTILEHKDLLVSVTKWET